MTTFVAVATVLAGLAWLGAYGLMQLEGTVSEYLRAGIGH